MFIRKQFDKIILSRKRNRVTSTAVFLTMLAVSDIVIILTGIFTNGLLFVWNVDIRASGEIMCKVHVFLTYFSIHLLSGILVLVTFERTICVISPHKVKLIFKRKNSLIWIACLGGALFLVNGHIFYGANILHIDAGGEMLTSYEPEGSPNYLYFMDNIWTWIDLDLSFFLPMCANFDRKYTYSCTSCKTTASGPGCRSTEKAITNAVITSPYYCFTSEHGSIHSFR